MKTTSSSPASFMDKINIKFGIKISDREFTLLRDYIYEKSGIYLDDRKKYLIENRFSNRLYDLGLKSFTEYYDYLSRSPHGRSEWDEVVEMITTNETFFFRDHAQLNSFRETVLKETLLAQVKKGRKRLRIWSAGCSSGEEPYTLSIIIHELLKTDLRNWDIKITANDISQEMLESAKQAFYRKHSLRATPGEMITKYFTVEQGGFRLNPAVTKLVSFSRINLNNQAEIMKVEPSELIFCRNVIIYFDDKMKQRLIASFHKNLVSGGYLTLGHSESLYGMTTPFETVKKPGCIFYRKQP